MGNDWTRLVQEAAVLGGPDGLRAHYRSQGRNGALASAAITFTAVGAAYGANKVYERISSKMMDRKIAELELTEPFDKANQSREKDGQDEQEA